MRLIDGDHLKRWILARWEKINSKTDYPLKAIDIIDQIDYGEIEYNVIQWIPVSERLPERCNYYIVTDFGSVEEAYYNSDGRWFSKDGDKLKDVMAWMPLPEPYKGDNNAD